MKLFFTLFAITLTTLILSSCSKTPEEPYYDRAKQASQNAQQELKND